MAAAGAGEVYQCRGLRKWADSRCEQCSRRRPVGHPHVGYYCNLHAGQAPAPDARSGKLLAPPQYADFLLTRVDSFRSEEELLTAELLVRVPPCSAAHVSARGAARHAQKFLPPATGGPPTLSGSDLVAWLTSDRKQGSAQAVETAEAMLQRKHIQPARAGVAGTTFQAGVTYAVRDPAATRAARQAPR